MNQRQFRRRIYIVDPEFQFGLIRKIAIIAVLTIIMSLSFLVAIYYLYGDVQIEVTQPDPFTRSNIISTLPQQVSLLKLLWPVLLICLSVTLAVTFFFGIVISHRMAGPIYRVKHTLAKMSRGDLRGEIRLRKKDDFKSLAASVNILRNRWHIQVIEIKRLIRKLETGDEKISEDARDRINRILSGFKTD